MKEFSNENPEYKSLSEIRVEAYQQGRVEAIDECIHIVASETHDGTLCDLLEELKENK